MIMNEERKLIDMEAFELFLPQSNPFVNNYINRRLEVEKYFDYDPFQEDVFQKRYDDILSRTYKRDELADVLIQYHKRLNATEQMMENILKLKNPNSVVVVGGQQAGLLTGPLYTIHKIISILALAKEQEKKLNIPVVPVFWIAGEDHDFDEINHLYVADRGRLKKKTIMQTQRKKTMISELSIDKNACRTWLEEVFAAFGETKYTKHLLASLYHELDQSATYVEFFERLLISMFGDEGIVLINSGSKELRELEKSYFEQMLMATDSIYHQVVKQQQILKEEGYPYQAITMRENCANLFYQIEDERYLLIEKEKNLFSIPEINWTSSLSDLLEEVRMNPWKFSNNVVTRPVMQEYLLPTLAFIAGPGEIAYWAELKGVFHLFSMNVPPVIPRIHLTILERNIESDLLELDLPLEEVLKQGVEPLKHRWFKQKEPFDVSAYVSKAKEEIEDIHRSLREKIEDFDQSLAPVLRKNAQFIEQQIDFVERIVQKKIHAKYEAELQKFRRIEYSLKPNNQWQERVWNIYYYLNKYGPNFVKDLQQLTYTFNGKHKIVKL
ncbi:bacillithiol biosynthesis cysteine-adding enzyme BshC [Bacillaceae bacterium ZC4]|nr:bacillithiol biosynthesis cysteine-adding enzyme BshC [Bacillaceae bacterium ZC4]